MIYHWGTLFEIGILENLENMVTRVNRVLQMFPSCLRDRKEGTKRNSWILFIF